MTVRYLVLALLLTGAAHAQWRVTPLAELEHTPIAAGFTGQWAQVVCAQTTTDWHVADRGADGKVSAVTCADRSQVRVLTVDFGEGGNLSPMGGYFLTVYNQTWLYSTADGKCRELAAELGCHRDEGPTWTADDKWLAWDEHGCGGYTLRQFCAIELPGGTRTVVETPDEVGTVRFKGVDCLVVDDTIWRRDAQGAWKNEGKTPLLAGIHGAYGSPTGAGSRYVIPRDHYAGTKGLAFVDLAQGTRREVFDLDKSSYSGAFEADGGGTVALLFSFHRDEVYVSRIAIWDVEALRERTSFEFVQPKSPNGGPVNPRPAFSPDGSLIAVHGQDRLWNTADGSVAVQLPGRAVISGATSFGHGDRLVVTVEGQKAKLIKIEKQ